MLTGRRLFPVIERRAAVSVPSMDNYAARQLANRLVNTDETNAFGQPNVLIVLEKVLTQ
jgi:hypothetical protein